MHVQQARRLSEAQALYQVAENDLGPYLRKEYEVSNPSHVYQSRDLMCFAERREGRHRIGSPGQLHPAVLHRLFDQEHSAAWVV
jgi:hypothetical protein